MFRRRGGVAAVVIGIGMVLGSIVLLYWNEGRALTAIRALDRARHRVVEIDPAAVAAAAEGKLVHLSGLMQTNSPARDTVFGVQGGSLLRLRRTVEMLQWQESKAGRSDDYSYRKVWSEEPIDSTRFHEAGHGNPPMPSRSAVIDAGDVRLGAYGVDAGVLTNVSAFAPLNLTAAPEGYRRIGDWLYRAADAADPAIGDIRVTFTAVPAQIMSVVAAVAAGMLVPYQDDDGYEIALASPGKLAAGEMLRARQQEEQALTWALRVAGFLLMLGGTALCFHPLSAIVASVPLVAGAVRLSVFLVSLTIAVPGTLLTIAVAWVAHRPLLGGGLVILAIGSAVGFRRLHRRRSPPVIAPEQRQTA